MTEEQKRKAIEEFFLAPKPRLSLKPILVGSGMVMLGAMAMSGELAAGLTGFGSVLTAVGALWILFKPIRSQRHKRSTPNEARTMSVARYMVAKARYGARPSLRQMVEWLKEDLARLGESSKTALSLDETTRDPIIVIGPLYGQHVEGLSPSTVLRRKVSNGYFYSTYRVSIFQFTDHFLGVYQANFSMIKNVTTAEVADEFFYRDVVSVRTQTKASSYTLKNGEKLEHAKMFTLSVSSGDRISVVINDPKIQLAEEVESLGTRAVNNVKAMVRQYKLLERAS